MKTFRIAQISDLHLDPLHPEWEENARRAIADAYAQKAALIVFSGDMANNLRDLVRFQRIASELHLPFRTIPGNHECGTDPILEPSSFPCNRQLVTEYRLAAGLDHWAIQGDPALLVGINSSSLNVTWSAEEDQIEWLEDQLSREGRNEAVLFMHHAPALVDINERNSYWAVCSPGRMELFHLLKRHGVRTVFHGHLHYYCTRTIEGIQIVGAPSTSFPVITPDFPQGDAQLGYIIIDISEEAVSHRRITL